MYLDKYTDAVADQDKDTDTITDTDTYTGKYWFAIKSLHTYQV